MEGELALCMPVCLCVCMHACASECACVCVCAHAWSPPHQGLQVPGCPPHLPAWLRLPLATCLPLGLCLDGFLFPLPSLSLFHTFLPRFAPHSELLHSSRTKAMSYFVCDFEAAPRDLCSDCPHHPVTTAPLPLCGFRSDNWACPWTISEGPDPSSQLSVEGRCLAVMPPRWNAQGTGAGTSV